MSARPRILVVDDDPRSRRLLEGLLRFAGYDVASAEDGPTALADAERHAPDLVLLDVMMPGMSGFDVCRELRRRDELRTTQVMMVTALDAGPDLVAGLDCGADDFVSKPVRRDELLAKVRALLRVHAVMGELEDARRELAERNRELELKRTLAQTLVHDLKNPLAAIMGNLDLIARRADAGVAEPLRRGRAGAARMRSMIVDLLDVERLEEGRMRPERRPVDLCELARAAVAEAAPAAERAGVAVRLVGDGPAVLEADAGLCRRLIARLLDNAISRSAPGDGVEVAVEDGEGRIALAVTDRGPRVPPAEREHIFDKYHRAAGGSSRPGTNRGLGLTLCRLVAEAHGGAVRVDDAPDGGAAFRVTMPAVGPAEADGRRAASA